MKTMILSFAAALVIAVIADLGLDRAGFSSAEQQSTAAVRLD